MTKPLRSYQQTALAKSDGMPGFAYLMEQRTGKTPTTIKDIERSYLRGEINAVIVVCPRAIITDWVGSKEDESGFAYWFEPEQYAVAWETGTKPATTKKRAAVLTTTGGDFLRVFVVNYDMIARTDGFVYKTIDTMLNIHKCAIVFDESQRVKDPDARRSKMALRLSKRAAMIRILSGTPATESPLNYWTQGTMIGITPWQSSYLSFRNRYAVMRKGIRRDSTYFAERNQLPHWQREILDEGLTAQVDGRKAPDHIREAFAVMEHADQERIKRIINAMMKRTYMVVEKYQNLDELQALLAPYSFRITRKEAWPETPDKQYSKLYVDMGWKQQRAYDEMCQKLRTELDGEDVTAQMAITKLLRLQQIVGGFVGTDSGAVVPIEDNNRVTRLVEYLEDVEGKVIIWARYTAEIEAIMEALKKAGRRPLHFYGKTTDRERELAKAAFRAGAENDYTDFVANPAAGDVGLTLDGAGTVIYYSNHESLDKRLQSEDRPVSIVNKVQVIDMQARGTVDEKIVEALRGKCDLSSTLMGDELRSWI